MNNQTHPILPNSNGRRTEPLKKCGSSSQNKKKERRRCASNWKRADPRDRDEFKKKKKSLARIEKKKDKIPRTRS
jgi:hypothetical protein